MKTRKAAKLRMQIGTFAAVGLFFLILPGIAFSGIWTEDFTDGNDDGWEIVVDEWKVKNGAYEGSDQSKSYSRVLIGEEAWANYTVECDVTLLEAVAIDAAGLLLRCDATGKSGYRFWIRHDTGVFEVYKWENGNWAAPNYLTQNIPIDFGETYRLRIEADGFDFRCFVNGEEIGEFEDETKFRPSGRIGLVVCNAHAAFDNIIISGDQIVGNPVEYAGKLAAIWGEVKAK